MVSRIVARATLFGIVSVSFACRRRHPLVAERDQAALDPGKQSGQIEAAEVLMLPGIALAGGPRQHRRRCRLAGAVVLVEQPVGRGLIAMPDMRGRVAVVPLARANALQARRIEVEAPPPLGLGRLAVAI